MPSLAHGMDESREDYSSPFIFNKPSSAIRQPIVHDLTLLSKNLIRSGVVERIISYGLPLVSHPLR